MAGDDRRPVGRGFAVNTRAHFLVAAAGAARARTRSPARSCSSARRRACGRRPGSRPTTPPRPPCSGTAGGRAGGHGQPDPGQLVVPSLVDTARAGGVAPQPGPHRAEPAVRPPGDGLEVAYATIWLLSGEFSYVNAHPLNPSTAAPPASLTASGLGTGLQVDAGHWQAALRCPRESGRYRRPSPARFVLGRLGPLEVTGQRARPWAGVEPVPEMSRTGRYVDGSTHRVTV